MSNRVNTLTKRFGVEELVFEYRTMGYGAREARELASKTMDAFSRALSDGDDLVLKNACTITHWDTLHGHKLRVRTSRRLKNLWALRAATVKQLDNPAKDVTD